MRGVTLGRGLRLRAVPLGACPAGRARAAPRSRHFPRGRRCGRGRSCPVRAAAVVGTAGRDDERQRGAKLRRTGNTRSPSMLRGRAPHSPPSPHTPPSPSGGAGSLVCPRVPFRGRRRLCGSGEVDGGGAAPRVRRPAPSWAGTARPGGTKWRPRALRGPPSSVPPLRKGNPVLILPPELPRSPLLGCSLIQTVLRSHPHVTIPAPRAWRPGVSGSPLI